MQIDFEDDQMKFMLIREDEVGARVDTGARFKKEVMYLKKSETSYYLCPVTVQT